MKKKHIKDESLKKYIYIGKYSCLVNSIFILILLLAFFSLI